MNVEHHEWCWRSFSREGDKVQVREGLSLKKCWRGWVETESKWVRDSISSQVLYSESCSTATTMRRHLWEAKLFRLERDKQCVWYRLTGQLVRDTFTILLRKREREENIIPFCYLYETFKGCHSRHVSKQRVKAGSDNTAQCSAQPNSSNHLLTAYITLRYMQSASQTRSIIITSLSRGWHCSAMWDDDCVTTQHVIMQTDRDKWQENLWNIIATH